RPPPAPPTHTPPRPPHPPPEPHPAPTHPHAQRAPDPPLLYAKRHRTPPQHGAHARPRRDPPILRHVEHGVAHPDPARRLGLGQRIHGRGTGTLALRVAGGRQTAPRRSRRGLGQVPVALGGRKRPRAHGTG